MHGPDRGRGRDRRAAVACRRNGHRHTLRRVRQRAVVLGRGDVITPGQIVFQSELNRYVLDVEQKVRASTPLEEMLHDVLREAIKAALRLTDQDHQKAAVQLGLSLDAFEGYLKELGV